jgi:hypothetical protein
MILILYIVFIILVLVGVGWLKQKISQRSLTKVFRSVFKDSQIQLPTLKIASSYSWPTFDITFLTKEDLEFAETSGLIKQFKNRIRSRYTKDFDPDRAINCTYVGHVPSWKAMFDERTNEMDQDKG